MANFSWLEPLMPIPTIHQSYYGEGGELSLRCTRPEPALIGCPAAVHCSNLHCRPPYNYTCQYGYKSDGIVDLLLYQIIQYYWWQKK
ncbi:hypothetical protein V2G26_020616 [Clonostachys chloroleuca]